MSFTVVTRHACRTTIRSAELTFSFDAVLLYSSPWIFGPSEISSSSRSVCLDEMKSPLKYFPPTTSWTWKKRFADHTVHFFKKHVIDYTLVL